jgi:hypothetical protein
MRITRAKSAVQNYLFFCFGKFNIKLALITAISHFEGAPNESLKMDSRRRSKN